MQNYKTDTLVNVLSNCFHCARKSITVFERHIFMPEHLNFLFTDVTQNKHEISLVWHLPYVAQPTSSLHFPNQSPESSGLVPFKCSLYHAYDIKNHCAAVGNGCMVFSGHVRGRAAAQLRGNIDASRTCFGGFSAYENSEVNTANCAGLGCNRITIFNTLALKQNDRVSNCKKQSGAVQCALLVAYSVNSYSVKCGLRRATVTCIPPTWPLSLSVYIQKDGAVGRPQV